MGTIRGVSGPYTHDPAETPEDCLDAVLHEHAGAHVDDRRAMFEHGQAALAALVRQLDDARLEAQGWREHADDYGAELLKLAGVDPPDPRQSDPYAAAELIRARLAAAAPGPHIALDADLNAEDDRGRGYARRPGGLDVSPGDVLTAGRPGFWAHVVVEEVTDSAVYFRQVHGGLPDDLRDRLGPEQAE